MLKKLAARARPTRMATAGFVLMGVTLTPGFVFAHGDHEQATVKPVAQPVRPVANGITVVRDADTGQLRAPTAEEAAALEVPVPQATMRVAPTKLEPRAHPNGARGSRLTDESMSHTVMLRQPDGTLAARCFGSREEAEAALRATSVVFKTSNAPTE